MHEEDTKGIQGYDSRNVQTLLRALGPMGAQGRGDMVGNQVYASWQNSIFSSYTHWKIMLLINQNLIQKCMKAESRRSQPENTLYSEYRVREVQDTPAETRSHSSMRGRDKQFRSSLRAAKSPQQWNSWCLNLLRPCVNPTQSSPLRPSKNSYWGDN